MLLHTILFAAFFHLFSFHPACISWGFLTRVFYRLRESALCLTSDWWVRPPYYIPWRMRWSSSAPGHWVSTLVASYDTRVLQGAILVPSHHMGSAVCTVMYYCFGELLVCICVCVCVCVCFNTHARARV